MNTSESIRRLPAEWEEQSAVQLTFPHPETDWAPVLSSVLPCFVEIALAISRFEPVLIVCQDVQLARNSFPDPIPSAIHFLEAPNNDTWARDHGGITIEEQGKPVILDFVFNGWGLKFPADKDNLITGQLFKKGVFQAKYQHGGMVLEGGGIESDGQGTLLTTSECLLSPNRNPHMSRKDIEEVLMDRFGVNRVLWLEHGFLAGDDTDSHIDTLARLCTPDTIAYVKCIDLADEHFMELDLMEKELQQFRTEGGKPYKLVPLPWPDACYDETGERLPATYANFLIINNAVLVPTYQVPQDPEAIEIISSIFPDREVIGIDCSTLILQHGSLHCVTMQYPRGVVRLG
jgi:agmatine deiminase